MIQQSIHLGITKSQLCLIGLADPQVGGRRLRNDFLRNVQERGQLPDLRLVQVADGIQGGSQIAVKRPVPQQELGFVAG